MNYTSRTLLFLLILLVACKPAQKSGSTKTNSLSSKPVQLNTVETNDYLKGILKKYPQYFDKILTNAENRIQIIYTQIDRSEKLTNQPQEIKFSDHYFNVNEENYFYPASTVKFPIAILALQKLKELNIPGLDMNTTMITESDDEVHTPVYNDPTTVDGRPTIAGYIKKILLVSDNDAFNRLYEFLGQEYINNSLHKMGYKEIEIIHRLEVNMTEEQNRYTNPVNFFDSNGKIIYSKTSEKSKMIYANRDTKIGKGFYRNSKLVNEPFDFSKKNRMSIKSLHNILRSIIFPEMVSTNQRFNLSKDDYSFLRKYMSMMPQESEFPSYDPVNYWDTYVKFLLYGSEKNTSIPEIRIFNKVGDAYGFLIDAAYIVDFKNNIEFILSAVILCNSDGIFNDDKYDYDDIGFPFMKQLGQVIYEEELKRKRNHKPDLSPFVFDYHN